MVSSHKTFLLLHGAWHAGWCWRRIIPLLSAMGHTVIAPDLPGHGADNTPFDQITLETYVTFIKKIINAQIKPVILVGHSMAGVIISQLAEYMPEKIEQLIYLAAFIPSNGESLSQEAKKSSLPGVGPERLLDKENCSIALKSSERLITLFYGNCTIPDVNYALLHLQEEPSKPFLDPIHYSAARFGKVKKRYIACLQDQAVPWQDQQRMYDGLITDIVELDSDHSPFFSMPDILVKALLK